MNTMTDIPYRRLAAAIIKQAARDARASNPRLANEARAWLEVSGLEWLAALGFNVGLQCWLEWIDAGCPGDLNTSNFEEPELEAYS